MSIATMEESLFGQSFPLVSKKYGSSPFSKCSMGFFNFILPGSLNDMHLGTHMSKTRIQHIRRRNRMLMLTALSIALRTLLSM